MFTQSTHPSDALQLFLRRHGIRLKDSHIVLALSGGLDSVTLAHLLADLRELMNFDLSLAHVNHHLRPDSDADEAFCTMLAERLDMPLSVTHLNPQSRGRESVEAWARDRRYAALENAADEAGADWIVTAHHADDQVETVLMRLQQGASLLTLAGIRPVRGRLMRPLLDVSRSEIAEWALEHRLQWIEDPTNADTRFLRNKLRHGLLKATGLGRGESRETLLRLSRLGQDYERHCAAASESVVSLAIAGTVQGSFALPGGLCLSSDDNVLKLALKDLARTRLRLSVNFKDPHWQSFRQFVKLSGSGKVFDLTKGMKALKNRGEIVFYAEAVGTSTEPIVLMPGLHQWGAHEFQVGRLGGDFDAGMPLNVRAMRRGDRITTRAGHRRLVSDIMVDNKLSVLEKRHWPVVAEHDGRAVWVPGLGVQAGELRTDEWRMQWRQLTQSA